MKYSLRLSTVYARPPSEWGLLEFLWQDFLQVRCPLWCPAKALTNISCPAYRQAIRSSQSGSVVTTVLCLCVRLSRNKTFLLISDELSAFIALMLLAGWQEGLAPILHLASSEQWCWSGGRGILTELSLCYRKYCVAFQHCTIIMSSSFRLVYWIRLWSHWT